MSNPSDNKVPQARYALLHRDRKGWIIGNKFVLVTVVVVLLSCITLLVYAMTAGIYDQLLFPKHEGTKDIAIHSINRAILYNTVGYAGINKTVELKYIKSNSVENFKLVCYYAIPDEKSVKENNIRSLLPANIDPNMCTHINIAFGTLKNSSIHLEPHEIDVINKVVALKNENKQLKVLLSIGGAGSASEFPIMVLNHEHRKTFLKSIDFHVRQYKLDGIDLDWEFPNRDIHNDTRQKVHFTQLLYEIRNEINRQDKHKFLLSVAVAAPFFLASVYYDISYMNEYVDYINLMSYDYHFYTKITPITGFNSPLYARPEDATFFDTLNINYSANYWHANGMDKHKIIIGLPTYGHSFKLWNANNNGIGAPAKGYGSLGGNGFIDYNDVCWFLAKNQIKPIFDMDTKSPYATKYTEWISYDDQTSLTFKAEYIKNNNFGGAMIFSLNADDHLGYCKTDAKPVHFPLTRRVKTVLIDQQL